ncbi:MAG: DUF58 domain-containing protein [Spirochaetaceae bacterium]|nr:DUF58 domain-containing protein [Spirochaetaceae bacterium]
MYRLLFVFFSICFLFSELRIVRVIALTGILLILFARLYIWLSEKYVTAFRSVDTLRTSCGERLTITFSVVNKSFLPLFCCYASDSTGELSVVGPNRFICHLRPRKIRTCSYSVFSLARGCYKTGPVVIKACDPFRFFSFTKTVKAECSILVYPAKIPFFMSVSPAIPQGALTTKNICYEDVTMRRSIRSYKNGDELKRINWKVSAKYGALFTNEYQCTFDEPVFVFLNLAIEDYPLELRYDKGERAIEIAAAIVTRAAQLHQKCGFAAFGSGFPFLFPAKNQLGCILDVLALIKMEKGSLSYDPYQDLKHRLPSGTKIYTIGPEDV